MTSESRRDLIAALESMESSVTTGVTAAPPGFRFTDALGCGIAPPRVLHLPAGTATDKASLQREARKGMQDYRALRFSVPADTESGSAEWEKMVAGGVPRYRDDGTIEHVGLNRFQRDLVPEDQRQETVPEKPLVVGQFSEESRVYRRDLSRR